MAFAFVMLTFILSSNIYVFYRLYQLMPSTALRVALIAFAVIAIGSFIVSFMFRNVFPASIVGFLYKLGTTWFFIMIYLLIFFLIADLLRLTPLPIKSLLSQNRITLGVLTVFFAIIFIAGFIRYHHKNRVELHFDLSENQHLKQPIKIVAISDLHLGYAIGNNELQKWIELINKEQPDVVLLAGDVIDNTLRPLIEKQTDTVLKKINARYGVFAVPGNHEYISGIEESKQFCQQSDITLLADSMILVNNSFYIAGRDDRSNPNRKTIASLCCDADPSKPIILLDHQPYHLEEAEQNHITLQISGHTHNGQILPISWIVKGMYEKPYGYYQKGDTHYYITSGIGIWGGKFRIGTRSEYVVITMK